MCWFSVLCGGTVVCDREAAGELWQCDEDSDPLCMRRSSAGAADEWRISVRTL